MFLSPLEVVTRSDQLQLYQVTRRLYHKAQRNSVLELKLEAFRSQASAPFTNSSECAVLLEQIRPYLDRHCSNLTLDKFNPTQRQVQQLQQKLKQLNQREQHINTIELQHVFAYFTQHYQYLSSQQYSDWSTHLTTTRLIETILLLLIKDHASLKPNYHDCIDALTTALKQRSLEDTRYQTWFNMLIHRHEHTHTRIDIISVCDAAPSPSQRDTLKQWYLEQHQLKQTDWITSQQAHCEERNQAIAPLMSTLEQLYAPNNTALEVIHAFGTKQQLLDSLRTLLDFLTQHSSCSLGALNCALPPALPITLNVDQNEHLFLDAPQHQALLQRLRAALARVTAYSCITHLIPVFALPFTHGFARLRDTILLPRLQNNNTSQPTNKPLTGELTWDTLLQAVNHHFVTHFAQLFGYRDHMTGACISDRDRRILLDVLKEHRRLHTIINHNATRTLSHHSQHGNFWRRIRADFAIKLHLLPFDCEQDNDTFVSLEDITPDDELKKIGDFPARMTRTLNRTMQTLCKRYQQWSMTHQQLAVLQQRIERSAWSRQLSDTLKQFIDNALHYYTHSHKPNLPQRVLPTRPPEIVEWIQCMKQQERHQLRLEKKINSLHQRIEQRLSFIKLNTEVRLAAELVPQEQGHSWHLLFKNQAATWPQRYTNASILLPCNKNTHSKKTGIGIPSGNNQDRVTTKVHAEYFTHWNAHAIPVARYQTIPPFEAVQKRTHRLKEQSQGTHSTNARVAPTHQPVSRSNASTLSQRKRNKIPPMVCKPENDLHSTCASSKTTQELANTVDNTNNDQLPASSAKQTTQNKNQITASLHKQPGYMKSTVSWRNKMSDNRLENPEGQRHPASLHATLWIDAAKIAAKKSDRTGAQQSSLFTQPARRLKHTTAQRSPTSATKPRVKQKKNSNPQAPSDCGSSHARSTFTTSLKDFTYIPRFHSR